MGVRGPKPKKLVNEKWSPQLAYAVGLIATDGCLLPGHAIDLTSKDRQQLVNFSRCLGLNLFIGKKSNGRGQNSFRVQFKNVIFYNFLLRIGLTPKKSKTIGPLAIPDRYFFDFLRGVFDGDGCTYSYWDSRWKSSFMYYLCFASASTSFVKWLRKQISIRLDVSGHITTAGRFGMLYNLKYAKKDGFKILKQMYHSSDQIFLMRKYLKVRRMLAIVGQSV
jgi:hypothetical protein